MNFFLTNDCRRAIMKKGGENMAKTNVQMFTYFYGLGYYYYPTILCCHKFKTDKSFS